MTRKSVQFVSVVIFSLLCVTGCGNQATDARTPIPTPTPTSTAPYPAANIATLEPADPTASEFDDHPAVQVLRQTDIVTAWANLIDYPYFAQVTQYIDRESGPGIIGFSQLNYQYQYVAVGPYPSVIESVADIPGGGYVVTLCLGQIREVNKFTGDVRDHKSSLAGTREEVTLSPLTDAELAELAEQNLEAPPLRVREYDIVSGECDASSAIFQEFVDWEQYAPIGEYRLTVQLGEP